MNTSLQPDGARPPSGPAHAVPTDARGTASVEATGYAVDFPVRLPVLRRPPGWAVLEESALRTRAVQLLHAWVVVPSTVPRPAGAVTPDAPMAVSSAAAARAHPTAQVSAVTPRAHAGDAPRQRPRPRSGMGVGLMALLGLMGLMALAPWLIWAPLVGGLALGILLLQTGLLRRWLVIQHARAALADAEVQAAQEARTAPEPVGEALPDEARTPRVLEAPLGPQVRAVQAVKAPVVRMAHGGWLLTATLVLVGLQAAMLIATVQVQRASAVKPVRAEKTDASARMPEAKAPEDRGLGLTLRLPTPAPDRSTDSRTADRGPPHEATR